MNAPAASWMGWAVLMSCQTSPGGDVERDGQLSKDRAAVEHGQVARQVDGCASALVRPEGRRELDGAAVDGDVVGQAVVVAVQADECDEHGVGYVFVAAVEVPGEVEEAARSSFSWRTCSGSAGSRSGRSGAKPVPGPET
jgi:hypothetical protein